jgi:hypothetical protein
VVTRPPRAVVARGGHDTGFAGQRPPRYRRPRRHDLDRRALLAALTDEFEGLDVDLIARLQVFEPDQALAAFDPGAGPHRQGDLSPFTADQHDRPLAQPRPHLSIRTARISPRYCRSCDQRTSPAQASEGWPSTAVIHSSTSAATAMRHIGRPCGQAPALIANRLWPCGPVSIAGILQRWRLSELP